MRKRNLFVTLIFISCLVMFSAAASTARTQPTGLTGSPAALTNARREALKLDKRAYKRSEAYRKTQLAKPLKEVG